MALSVFADRSKPPGRQDLAAVLGPVGAHWASVERFAASLGPVEPTWGFASAAFGWSLRLVAGDRVLAYLTPRSGAFLFGIALGDRVAAQACAGRLPARVRSVLEEAPRYAEGRGIRFEVRTAADVGVATRLLALKVGDAPPSRPRRRVTRR